MNINTRIAMSAISIVTSLALMTGAAFAAFTSTATNTGNSFAAGTLVLNINSTAPTSTGALQVTNAIPGVPQSADLELTNTGSIDASSVNVSGITIGGNNISLASDVTLVLFDDANNSGVLDTGEAVLGNAHLNDGVWTGLPLTGVTVAHGGAQYHLGAQVTLDSGAPNSDQGKNMTFDIALQANQ